MVTSVWLAPAAELGRLDDDGRGLAPGVDERLELADELSRSDFPTEYSRKLAITGGTDCTDESKHADNRPNRLRASVERGPADEQRAAGNAQADNGDATGELRSRDGRNA